MITLDVRTLMVTTGVIYLVCFLVTLSLWLQTRNRFKGLAFWVVDFALGALGSILVGLRGTIPDWASIMLSNALILGGALLLFLGFQRFIGKKIISFPNAIALAVYFAVLYVQFYYLFIEPSQLARNINFSSGLAIWCILSFGLLTWQVKPEIRRYTIGTRIALICIVLISLLRILGFVAIPQASDFLASGEFDTSMVLLLGMTVIFLTLNLILMVFRISITETMNAEHNARSEKAKLEAVFNTTYMGCATLVDRKIQDVNEALCRLLGYKREELLGKDSRIVYVTEEEYQKSQSLYAEAATHSSAEGESRFIRKDGKISNVFISLSALNKEDASKGMVISVMDITARKLAEQLLKTSEERLQSIFSTTSVGIAVLADQVIQEVNDAFGFILGYDSGELIGYATRSLYASEQEYQRAGNFYEFLKRRSEFNTETQWLHKDGHIVFITIGAASLEIWHPEKGVTITITDITERKLQEKLLQDALEEKDVLLREITHRVKNNLAAVIGLMNMRARSSSNPAVQGMVQDLTGHIRSMALAHEMLLHSGTYKYIKMDNYLETLLADVPRFFEREHPVTVTVKVDDTRLDMDTAVPVGMLASELVTNALKHAFPESKNHLDGDECAISVSLKQSDGRVLLEVSDNGVGLPRGFDLKNTSSMGMHLLHMLGEHQLRGIIDIDSTHGMTFALNFPVKSIH